MKRTSLAFVCSILLFTSCKETTQKEKSETSMNTENPLLTEWNTPFGVPPFDKIKSSDYAPAFDTTLAKHKEEIQAIIDNAEIPNF